MFSLAAGALIFAGSISASIGQNATTDPVGVVTLDASGSSDTAICPPLQRPKVFSGSIGDASGAQLTIQGAQGWQPNQFAYSSPAQLNTYYALVKSGARAGAFYTVTGNGESSLTVDLAGDNLEAVLEEGDLIEVVPYWTLNTLFPGGQGFKPSSSFTPVSTLVIPNPTQAGAGLPASDKYFYYSGAAAGGAGWRKVGGAPTAKYNDLPLPPDSHFIVRHNSSGDTKLQILGDVRMVGSQTAIGTIQQNTKQDNHIGFPFPVPLTLAQSQLYESGAVSGSSTFTPTDVVLVYDNSIKTLNKPPTLKYFYYTGAAAGGPGWRKVGSAPTAKFDSQVVFEVGAGVVIQKSENSSPSFALFSTPRPF